MTQPKFAPILIEDEVRPAAHLDPPRAWTPHRPAEQRPGPRRHTGASGAPGPDQGYALSLAERIAPTLVLSDGEYREDAVAAIVAVALRRAASFGRAPVTADLKFAINGFGYDTDIGPDLNEVRRGLVTGTAHDYHRQRELADRCPERALVGRTAPKGPFLLSAVNEASA